MEDGSTQSEEITVVMIQDVQRSPSVAPDKPSSNYFGGRGVMSGRSVLNDKFMT